MGTFHYQIELAAGSAAPFESLETLVDSGVTYTLVPGPVLAQLGVESIGRQDFVMADGSRVEREIGQAYIRIDGETRASVVVFGDDAAEPLLGAVTLEQFGLGIDPVAGQLIPVPGYLVGLTRGDANDP